jgi:hypothetical protein
MTTFALTKQGQLYVVGSDNGENAIYSPCTMDLIPESQWDNSNGDYEAELTTIVNVPYSNIFCTDTDLFLLRKKQELLLARLAEVARLTNAQASCLPEPLIGTLPIPLNMLVEIVDEHSSNYGMRLFTIKAYRDCGALVYDIGTRDDIENEKLISAGNLNAWFSRTLKGIPVTSLRVVNRKLVWLNIKDGKFSNSWQLSDFPSTGISCLIEHALTKASIKEEPITANWFLKHHKDCGTAYRGCSPECPKNHYEETEEKEWICFKVGDHYTTNKQEAMARSSSWKLLEFECLTDSNFSFSEHMRLR